MVVVWVHDEGQTVAEPSLFWLEDHRFLDQDSLSVYPVVDLPVRFVVGRLAVLLDLKFSFDFATRRAKQLEVAIP